MGVRGKKPSHPHPLRPDRCQQAQAGVVLAAAAPDHSEPKPRNQQGVEIRFGGSTTLVSTHAASLPPAELPLLTWQAFTWPAPPRSCTHSARLFLGTLRLDTPPLCLPSRALASPRRPTTTLAEPTAMPAAIAATRVSAQLKQDMTAAPARARAFAAAARPAHPAGCRCPAHGRRSVTVRGEHACCLVQHPCQPWLALLHSLGSLQLPATPPSRPAAVPAQVLQLRGPTTAARLRRAVAFKPALLPPALNPRTTPPAHFVRC